ncbi:MAG: hypothetical protein LQ345_005362, partial [Seirophora villosa]
NRPLNSSGIVAFTISTLVSTSTGGTNSNSALAISAPSSSNPLTVTSHLFAVATIAVLEPQAKKKDWRLKGPVRGSIDISSPIGEAARRLGMDLEITPPTRGGRV